MSDQSKNITNKIQDVFEGYQPIKRGYSPINSKLDTNKPPQGGSGVGQKESNTLEKSQKKSNE